VNAAHLTIASVLGILAVGLMLTERGPADPRRLSLIAALAAAAAAGRVLFTAVPSVQPVTVIVVATGATLGARAGFAVGALAPLLSNMLIGQGSWTPGQMALWGLAGLAGAALPWLCRRPLGLATVTFAWGWIFGWGMNLWELATFGPEVSVDAFAAKAALSVWFETAHAVGNLVFALTVGPALLRLLQRYRNRVDVRIEWQSPGSDVDRSPPLRPGGV
jgi:energy-coupling factor transport system substrate-specific component